MASHHLWIINLLPGIKITVLSLCLGIFCLPIARGDYLLKGPVNGDSLSNRLSQARGRERADLLLQLAYHFRSEGDKALQLADDALKLSEKLNYERGLGYACYIRAVLGIGKELPDVVMQNLKLAEKHAVAVSERELTMNVRVSLAYIESAYFKNYHASLEYIDGVLAEFADLTDCFEEAGYYRIKAGLLKELMKPEEEWDAILFSYSALILCQDIPVDSLSFISSILAYPGQFQRTHGHFQQAVYYYYQALNTLAGMNLGSSGQMYVEACLLGNLAKNYDDWGSYDSSLYYYRKSLAIFKLQGKEDDQPLERADLMEGIGKVYLDLSMFDSSNYYLNHAKAARIEGGDLLGIAMCNDGFGELHMLWGNYVKALSYLDSSLTQKKEYLENLSSGPPLDLRIQTCYESMANTYLLTGRLYRELGKSEPALVNFEQSKDYAIRAGYALREAIALREIGFTYMIQDSSALALASLTSSLERFQEMKILHESGRVLHDLGHFYADRGDGDHAYTLFARAEKIFAKAALQEDLAEIYKDMGDLSKQAGDLIKARHYLQESIQIAESFNLKKTASESYQLIYGIFEQEGNHKEAFRALLKYHQYESELFGLQIKKTIAQMEATFQLAENEKLILELEREKEMRDFRFRQSMYFNFTLAALIIIIVLFFVLIIRHNKIKAGQKLILTKQRLLRSQMNPHFIFNSLTNIQDYIFRNEPLKASRYLTNFSKLVRNILESSREDFIPLEMELSTIENYLELQKLRHDDKFDYRIEVNEAIDPSAVMIPPMLGQPFIENAVEHGLRHKDSRGLVAIRISKEGNHLHVEIEDNGIGRERSAEIMKNKDTVHRSRATEITKERLRTMYRKHRRRSGLVIQDLRDESGNPSGTRVTYEIYLKD